MNKDIKLTKVLKRILNYKKEIKIKLIIVLILSVLAALFSVITPYLLGLIITSLFDSFTKNININYNYIFTLIIILSIVYLTYSFFIYIKNYMSVKLAQNLCYNLRKDLIHKINLLDIKEIEKRKKGDIISIIVNDVEKINDFFTESIPELLYHLVLMIGIVFMMLYINIKLALITFLTIPIIFIFLAIIVKKTQRYFDLNQSHLGEVNSFIEESITNDTEIKSFNKEKYFNTKFNNENKKLLEYNFKSSLFSSLANPIINFINNLNYIIIVAVGAYFCLKGYMKVGEIQAFVKYMQEFSRPLAMLGDILGSVEITVSAANRIFEVIDNNSISDGFITDIEEPKLISLQNVNFSYSKDKQILKNINLDINRGEQIAIVGKTGSGKTTIINLLMGFYRVDSGKILIDGININDIKKSSLRDKFKMVLQDTWVINESIKENITLGKKVSEQKLQKAINEET